MSNAIGGQIQCLYFILVLLKVSYAFTFSLLSKT